MKSNNNSNEVIITFIYESANHLQFKCNINHTIETIINSFASKINKSINSLVFIYDGRQLKNEDFKKTLNQEMNFVNKEEKSLTILVFNMENKSREDSTDKDNINIILLIDNLNYLRLRGKKGEPIINIIKKANPNINTEFYKSTFNYKNNKVDLNKKFDDIADERDKEDKLIILTVFLIKVNFLNNKIGNKNMFFLPEEKLENICKKYCQKNNLNFNNIKFSTKERVINFNGTLNQLLNNNNNNLNEDIDNSRRRNITITNNSLFNDNIMKEIDIYVREINQISCFKKK